MFPDISQNLVTGDDVLKIFTLLHFAVPIIVFLLSENTLNLKRLVYFKITFALVEMKTKAEAF